MHRSLIREKVAFLALDAKVVIAGFREPLTDMRKPRYLYSHTMVPHSAVRSRLCLFPLSLLEGSNIGQTFYRSLECLRIFREKDQIISKEQET